MRKDEARGKGEVAKPGILAAAVHELAGNSNVRSKECKQPQGAKDADGWLEQVRPCGKEERRTDVAGNCTD